MAHPTALDEHPARAPQAEEDDSIGLSGLAVHDLVHELLESDEAPGHPGGCRIVLVRHGQPHIDLRPRTTWAGFHKYIGEYEAAGLHPDSHPPEDLLAILAEIPRATASVLVSSRPRALESAIRLLPASGREVDALFAEAPLVSPPIPLLKMRVPKWAILGRLVWHAGYHPDVEGPAAARDRARATAARLIERASRDGAAILIAHGYFNYMVGGQLSKLGFKRKGSHRARFWNPVVYDRG